MDVRGWGSGEVSGAKWEVGSEVEDTFAKAMLEEVMNGEVRKRGRAGGPLFPLSCISPLPQTHHLADQILFPLLLSLN